MKIIIFIITVYLMVMLTGCGPLAAVGIVGSQITKSLYENERLNPSPPPPGTARTTLDRFEIAQTNLNLGIEYLRQGEYQKAIEKLERAKQARSDYAPIYNAYGLLYQRLGKNKQAEESFKKSLRLGNNNPSTLNNYGQFLCSQNRDAEAEEHFLIAATNPHYSTPEIPYSNIGTCANMHGQPGRAVKYFEKALSLNPAIPTVYIQLCEIKVNQNEYSSAKYYLQHYLKYFRHSPKSLWMGIQIERELGDNDALASYSLLLRNQYPNSVEARLLSESIASQ